MSRSWIADLLIKTRFQGKCVGFLIHLEHQAQLEPDLGRRMLEYFILDWREYNLPVYPVAVLSHDPAGAKISSPLRLAFPNKRVLEFDFDVIDLPAMDARRYVKKRNPAALALGARMGVDPGERVHLVETFRSRSHGRACARRNGIWPQTTFSRTST